MKQITHSISLRSSAAVAEVCTFDSTKMQCSIPEVRAIEMIAMTLMSNAASVTSH
jgi:hypothetical protein